MNSGIPTSWILLSKERVHTVDTCNNLHGSLGELNWVNKMNKGNFKRLHTNLDIILKSRDITLPTKVSLVKAMVYPVVMYGCEIWTIKKAECQRIDAFELCVGEDS